MKLFRISLLLFCAILFSSCIAEWGDRKCQGDFTLFFEYRAFGNHNSVALFNDHVNQVTLFVFNEQGEQVHYQFIQEHQLRSGVSSRGTRAVDSPGVRLSTTTGDGFIPGNKYRVVAWGNANPARDEFYAERIDNARIGTPDGGTPLHFGPGMTRVEAQSPEQHEFWFTFPETVENEYEIIPFSRAHIEIQVFVVGASETPRVDLDGVADGISFDKEVTGGRVSFGRLANINRYTPEANPRAAQFVSYYVPLFTETTDKMLEISNTAGVLQNGEISISDVIAGINHINGSLNPIINLADTNNPVQIVPIVLEVEQGPEGDDIIVSIWVPGWVRRPVTPM